MIYGVKFVYVNLQTDGQAIWQKARSCCTKSLSWRRVKIFVVDIIKWNRLLSPCFCMACEAWSTLRDHVFVSIIVLPIVTHWLPIDNP